MENIKLAENFREVNITLNKNKTDNRHRTTETDNL